MITLKSLIQKNITFFVRYYQLAALATVITVATLVGSLMVGDSVRTTLLKRVAERLGDTETIIFSRYSFIEESLLEAPLFQENVRGILLTNGFISHHGRLIPVFVWGVNDRQIARGTARMNRALLREIGEDQPNAIALRLPASGLIPSGSLFVTDNYTTSMRLSFDGIVAIEDGGNISMKNEHTIPLNIFVNRNELAETMQTEGKINLMLANREISTDEFEKAWNFATSGMSVNYMNGFTEITSDRVFIQEEVVTTIIQDNGNANILFSYLANSIERDGMSIPYSFVTAMNRFQGETLQENEIILSDYSANRIHAKTGDRIQITYYTSKDLKTLQTDTVELRVKKIVPLSVFLADTTLSADFPGLSDVERCTDWDSDLPINMDLITDEDEKYWEDYRTAPKAIIAYNTVAGDWSNAYGNATAIRLEDSRNPDLSGLRSAMFGIQMVYPRNVGVFAAMNGVDFSGLFLALGFFIIISAILLMVVPLSEMLYRRKPEISLLKALGFTNQRITNILSKESTPVVLVASVVGVVAGFIYTSLVMWLLGNVWKGATNTDGFSVFPSGIAIIAGSLIGIGLSLWILRITIVRHLKEKKIVHRKKKTAVNRKKIFVLLASMATLAITGLNVLLFNSVALFVTVGVLLLATAAIWGDYLICSNGSPVATEAFSTNKLVWGTLLAQKKQALLSFFTLATGVFIVFSVGLNRKGFTNNAQILAGTGGYTLWCESTVPVYHNMMTTAGREKLSLTDLPDNTEILQCLRLNADDASCLNLNKVSTPTVLGIDMQALSESEFKIEQNIFSLDGQMVFDRLLTSIETKQRADCVYPALVDETVLIWSLGKSLGDTLFYKNDKGQYVAILLAGTLSNTIFQGNILIDRHLFTEIWQETAGSEVFLLKTNEADKEDVKRLLSQALNEYGIRVTTTNDRLQQFNAVSDTYLTIFMTLGGLGLLIGLMSFVVVIRKSLVSRRYEIALYKSLGFTNDKIESILFQENCIVPLYAIITGILCSLAGIGVRFTNTGIGVWLMAALLVILFVLYILLFVKKTVRDEINKYPT